MSILMKRGVLDLICSSVKSGRPLMIELGAGGRKLPGFLSIDQEGSSDILLDIAAQPLPFPDGSVSLVYSSHVLEHFSYPNPMRKVLAECSRVLMPGGKFSISVPDARVFIDAYLNDKPFPNETIYEPANHKKSKIDFVNYIAYMAGNHKHMFDSENLLQILIEAGFSGCSLREFDPSIDPTERKDTNSIYAKGFKPKDVR